MNKDDAAKFLGCSVRTLATYVQAGRIAPVYIKGKTRSVADYDETDLQKLKDELETPIPANRAEPSSTTLARFNPVLEPAPALGNVLAISAEDFPALVSAIRGTEQNRAEPGKSLLLSISEAAQFAGVSEGAIKKACDEGALTRLRGYARGYRIKRSEIEEWVENL